MMSFRGSLGNQLSSNNESKDYIMTYENQDNTFGSGNVLQISKENESNMDRGICPHCGQSNQTVFVHGHEQCVCCNTNLEPCCEGEESWGLLFHEFGFRPSP